MPTEEDQDLDLWNGPSDWGEQDDGVETPVEIEMPKKKKRIWKIRKKAK